jgi:hypothetical protein
VSTSAVFLDTVNKGDAIDDELATRFGEAFAVEIRDMDAL